MKRDELARKICKWFGDEPDALNPLGEPLWTEYVNKVNDFLDALMEPGKEAAHEGGKVLGEAEHNVGNAISVWQAMLKVVKAGK